MTLPNSIIDREYQKFTENGSGKPAVNTISSGNVIGSVFNIVSAQDLTDTYADFGGEIETLGCKSIGLWINCDVNNSEDVTLQVLGLHTSGGDEYDIDGINVKTLWTSGVSDFNKYYEFDVGVIPILQLQAKAVTVGATAGDLTIKATRLY